MTSRALNISRPAALKPLAQSCVIGLLAGLALAFGGHEWLARQACARVARDASESMVAFTPAMKQVFPAIVSVCVSKIQKPSDGPILLRWFPQRFSTTNVGGMEEVQCEDAGQSVRGSGVLVGPGGLLLTSRRLVRSAAEIVIFTTDHRQFAARVVGTDEASDLALLEAEAEDLPYVKFGDSSKSAVGDLTMAIGSPLSDGDPIVPGVISGPASMDAEGRVSFVHTLREMPPGSQGRAFINQRGELVGIHTSPWPDIEEKGTPAFAVPANAARQIMQEILARGSVHKHTKHRGDISL